jgi:hypothetical protein
MTTPNPEHDENSITELAQSIVRGDEPPVPEEALDERTRAAEPPARRIRADAVVSLRVPALLAQVMLAAAGVVSAVAVWFVVVQRALLERVENNPASVSVSDVLADKHRVDTLNAVWAGVFIATIVAFLVWFAIAYRSLDALGARRRYGKGWAVGGWFVPIANLFVPRRLAIDLWSGNRSESEPGPQAPTTSALVNCWWGAWIAGSLAILIRTGHDTTVHDALTNNTGYLIRDSILVLAAVLAIFVVRDISRWQARLVRLS